MIIYKVGDEKKAMCGVCEAFRIVSYQLRDVPFDDGSGMVKNIIAGVCKTCDSVAVIPFQSVPAIKKQLQIQRKAVETRVPAHMIDLLNMASAELGATPDFVPLLLKYYIHQLASNPEAALRLVTLLTSELATGLANKRLSLKGREIGNDIEKLKSLSQIDNTTELLKGVVLMIHHDLLVNPDAHRIAVLKSFVATVA
ncbi:MULTISPECIES: hypothetical protein [Rahnella]|jgi:hypothetical protein|uniref:HNH endonuclease 5 domain-containing protein n=1 Tax=Rahnella sp. (strain Y9602) TaxID=2703885 RepID=A0ABW6CAJ5_RAHSY|nr:MULTISPECIES: hypothetical protein [Rahnella]AYA06652.1 hypothetical protein D3Z09_08860 [Rahnella aquatilis]AZP41891.1 hypothetical protein EJP79_08550 [Rahnella aquatilis]AZP46232.1 hypothetical protein EJP81_08555 [Rahnella aquatilis]AZP50708.1 hypothetical protein EJP80_09350 [Rahnella aquatilis]MBU9841702.1 hypothetical protein [Rahnella aceris]